MKRGTALDQGKKILGMSALLGLSALAVSLTSTTAFSADHEMVIAHLFTEDPMANEVQPSLLHFEALVESATNGAIDVKIFPNGQLGSELESGRATQDGQTIQATIMSSGAMSSFYRDYQIITTPFLFNSYATAHAYFDGKWHADFMHKMVDSAGLRYLGTFDESGGFVAVTTNGRLVKTVEDFQGLTIRTEENPAHIATMKALGASATPLPWSEVHTALSTGLADGQFNPPGISTAYKLYEVTDYTTLTGHVYNSSTWVVSEKWFQSLPAAYRDVIITAARESVGIAHGIASLHAINGWTQSCEVFDECYVLPTSEREKMATIARPAWRKWITDDFGISAELVESLWAEVKRIDAQETEKALTRYAR